MNIEEQISYYDTLWSKRKRLNSLNLRRAIKILQYFDVVKKRIKNPRILDLGCGDGRLTSFLGEFGSADGIELSKDAVAAAKQKYSHVNFFQGDVLNYDFLENEYDVVVSQEVIEHIENQKAYLEICEKVLMKGGYVIMTTPNKKVFNHLKGGNWSHQPIEKIMTPSEFKSLFSEHFDIVAYDSIIFNFGKEGYFKFINHNYIIAGFKILGLKALRERSLSRMGFGLHQCILAKKK